MYGELLKQLDEVESSVFELIQDKQATSLQLEAFEGKHRKLQADLESKEKKHNIEENCFREKLKQLEQQKLQMKVKYEERYRGFCEELKRCTAKGKIYQKEAETAKRQLRIKIVEILQLEEKHKEMLEDEEKRKVKKKKEDVKTKQILATIEELNQELAGVTKSLDIIDTMKDQVIKINMDLQKRSENLQEDKEMLLIQINEIRKDNMTLRKNTDAEKDLIIGQLELEFQNLTQKLEEAKEDKISLEKQLGYANNLPLIDDAQD